MKLHEWIMEKDTLQKLLCEAEKQREDSRINVYAVCTHRGEGNQVFDYYIAHSNTLYRVAMDIRVRGYNINRMRYGYDRVFSDDVLSCLLNPSHIYLESVSTRVESY